LASAPIPLGASASVCVGRLTLESPLAWLGGFGPALFAITLSHPARSYRCALETHQASRTTRRRRRVPVALFQLEQLRPNCGSEVKSVRASDQSRRRPDRHKLPNGLTVDVEVKSTQSVHLLDRNPITFDRRNLLGAPSMRTKPFAKRGSLTSRFDARA
jgi:hypothetical protein